MTFLFQFILASVKRPLYQWSINTSLVSLISWLQLCYCWTCHFHSRIQTEEVAYVWDMLLSQHGENSKKVSDIPPLKTAKNWHVTSTHTSLAKGHHMTIGRDIILLQDKKRCRYLETIQSTGTTVLSSVLLWKVL